MLLLVPAAARRHALGLAPPVEVIAFGAVGVVALGEDGAVVPVPVVADGVEEVPPPEPPHGGALGRGHHRELRRHHRHRAPRAAAGGGGAAAEDELREVGGEGRVGVVDLVPAPLGGPGGAVPDGGVHGHGLGGEVAAHGRHADDLADGRPVHVEDDGGGGPGDGVGVRAESGVEGEEVALLAAAGGAAVAVDVGLDAPLVAPPVAQQLEVHLVVVAGEHVGVRQLHASTFIQTHKLTKARTHSLVIQALKLLV
jgi:hypothetical protein